MMKALLLIIFICTSSFSKGKFTFSQKELNYNDPKGDRILAKAYKEEVMGIKKLYLMLSGRMEELVAKAREEFPYFENELNYVKKELPVNIMSDSTTLAYTKNELLSSLAFIMNEYQINSGKKLTKGQCHKWSDEFLQEKGFLKIKLQGKLLVSLASGVTSNFLVTGQEKNLKDWVLSQEDRSITLEKMFYQSLIFNKGNLYLSTLTIENILSRYWIAKDRENLDLTNKLSPITMIYTNRGDIFGSWYHLWGLITYGICYPKPVAKVVGFVEHIGSQFSSRFIPEPGQKFISKVGGPVGSGLRKIITKNKPLTNYIHNNISEVPKSVYDSIEIDFKQPYLYISSRIRPISDCLIQIISKNEKGEVLQKVHTKIYEAKPSQTGRFKMKRPSEIEKINIIVKSCQFEE